MDQTTEPQATTPDAPTRYWRIHTILGSFMTTAEPRHYSDGSVQFDLPTSRGVLTMRCRGDWTVEDAPSLDAFINLGQAVAPTPEEAARQMEDTENAVVRMMKRAYEAIKATNAAPPA
jgi:hypothetical protein